jgi:hypothetical protein
MPVRMPRGPRLVRLIGEHPDAQSDAMCNTCLILAEKPGLDNFRERSIQTVHTLRAIIRASCSSRTRSGGEAVSKGSAESGFPISK